MLNCQAFSLFARACCNLLQAFNLKVQYYFISASSVSLKSQIDFISDRLMSVRLSDKVYFDQTAALI